MKIEKFSGDDYTIHFELAVFTSEYQENINIACSRILSNNQMIYQVYQSRPPYGGLVLSQLRVNSLKNGQRRMWQIFKEINCLCLILKEVDLTYGRQSRAVVFDYIVQKYPGLFPSFEAYDFFFDKVSAYNQSLVLPAQAIDDNELVSFRKEFNMRLRKR